MSGRHVNLNTKFVEIYVQFSDNDLQNANITKLHWSTVSRMVGKKSLRRRMHTRHTFGYFWQHFPDQSYGKHRQPNRSTHAVSFIHLKTSLGPNKQFYATLRHPYTIAQRILPKHRTIRRKHVEAQVLLHRQQSAAEASFRVIQSRGNTLLK